MYPARQSRLGQRRALFSKLENHFCIMPRSRIFSLRKESLRTLISRLPRNINRLAASRTVGDYDANLGGQFSRTRCCRRMAMKFDPRPETRMPSFFIFWGAMRSSADDLDSRFVRPSGRLPGDCWIFRTTSNSTNPHGRRPAKTLAVRIPLAARNSVRVDRRCKMKKSDVGGICFIACP